MSSSKGLVLVTGATGYIGSQVVLSFVEAGYRVRATARTLGKGKAWSEKYAQLNDRVEWAAVEDITADGAFDKAVQGVDVIAHVASPLPDKFTPGQVEKEGLIPAINGTKSILKSALKEPKVKRFVLTSSVVAAGLHKHLTTEEDWTELTYQDALNTTNPFVAYMVSKTLAEKAAWEFVAENKPYFDVTAINPGFVFGPQTQVVEDRKTLLSGTFAVVARLLVNPDFDVTDTNDKTGVTMPMVDVRDVALAHVKAAELDVAKGQRYMLVSGHFSNAPAVKNFRAWFPDHVDTIPQVPAGFQTPIGSTFDGTKATRELGFTYRTVEQTLKETAHATFEGLQKLQ